MSSRTLIIPPTQVIDSRSLARIHSFLKSCYREHRKIRVVDLDESPERFVRERAALVTRLKQLSSEEWHKTAVHEAYDHYSVFIMFRHVHPHETADSQKALG